MEKKAFLKILKKNRTGKASGEEKDFVNAYYNLFEARPDIINELNTQEKERLAKQIRDGIKIEPSGKSEKKSVYSLIIRLSAAAIFLIALGFIISIRYQKSNQPAKVVKHDVPPGGNKAILYLAGGRKIILNSVSNGTVIKQAGTRVVKTDSGQIVYNTTDALIGDDTVFNTIATPRGGQYVVILPDNSKVYLNALSSLRFPTAFSGTDRRVQLKGEAYFEVAHNNSKPFLVETDGQTVKVLGTHFNINAYGDETSIQTTLLEGRVEVSAGSSHTYLAPNEQSNLVYTRGETPVINVEKNADVEKVIAWKNGMFHFENDNIQTIMRQYARWYDVNVIYKGQLPGRLFSGEIRRDINASQALEILNFANIHFSIDGKTITIIP